ncbi:LysM peptidoglycan-binding domain-containing protein [Marinicella sp. S1101]|uniref:LysM peptidoglycan-binding domain-containing protein n=1 Tax=Marinicella marina TaxID=2996016 RepID=UPI0022609C28|nr:LysM peptidoglycan-binding domain-containing protein [Marinicella marina]MCX7553253.1 LysM peptidoglycan-binding domain-containing protein [Marinicella marina]MDJ1138985.1 LysM peptidoglycan-binding domain-containing protein [Marinicella marina]
MMFKKQHLIIALLLGFAFSALAQEVELNPSHPDTYVVQKGDTLWDISAVFLKSPWLWPEIWHANPQIENPHLIYPGDQINLVYLNGKPALTVNRSHPTVKLSPQVRAVDNNSAVETIPLKDIEPFLRKLRILNKEDIDLAPYVVAAEEDRNVSATSDLIYIRNLKNARQGDRLAIVRPTVIYREIPTDYPWETSDTHAIESVEWQKSSDYTTSAVLSRFWKKYIDRTYWENVKVLGYEVADTGVAEVVRVGTDDITTVQVIEATTEVKKGDLILPIDQFNFDPYFQPKAAEVNDENIRIVALNNALFGSGRRQIVAISNGSSQGVSVGDVFSVHSPERVIRDEVMHPKNDLKTLLKPSKAKVTLPMEYAGHIMVFKTFDNISYAIITDGNRPVKMYDYVKLP